jgi:uncharacterized membrane protein
MERLKKKIPEIHRKAWIIGGLGAAIGGGIGGFVSAQKGNYIYAGIGAALGYLVGVIISLLTRKKTGLKSLASVESTVNFVAGIVSLVMAIAGIVGFVLTRKLVGVVGALFFGACGIYLLKKKRRYS